MSQAFQVWCDIGGTFTDCIIVSPDGTKKSTKVLSHGVLYCQAISTHLPHRIFVEALRGYPRNFWNGATIRALDGSGLPRSTSACSSFEDGYFVLKDAVPTDWHTIEIDAGLEAPVLATRILLNCPLEEPLPPLEIRLGTTRGTNALLTRTGAKTALITTEGFADLLAIGYQERPELFELQIRKRQPLYESVAEIPERLDAQGRVLRPLDLNAAAQHLRDLYSAGFRSIAVCFIHSYCNGEHEKAIRQLAIEIGFDCVCLSHEIAPMIKAVSRGETTVVDAYLTPVVTQYLERVRRQFGLHSENPLLVMASSGGLLRSESYRGKDSVLSGPAGGAVALQAIAESLELPKLIGLDMGGTSTDVCRVDGELDLDFECIKAGVRMMSPTLRIHTVAAGGGSVCWFDGIQMRVGPQSAGSHPGPACYGKGGPLTITDLNLLAGRIDPSSFPFPLDRTAAEAAMLKTLETINADRNSNEILSSESLIQGFRRLANEHMAGAVRGISIAQGADPRTHSLVAFGGAAGQHICEIAEILGMDQIIDPPQAGMLSALGMGMASLQHTASLAIYRPLRELDQRWFDETRDSLKQRIAQSNSLQNMDARYRIEARFLGTEGSLTVQSDAPEFDPEKFEIRFRKKHRERFGYDRPTRPVEITVMHAVFRSQPLNSLPRQQAVSNPSKSRINTTCIHRQQMELNTIYAGPLLIQSEGSTTFVDRDWQAFVLNDRTLLIERIKSRKTETILSTTGNTTPQHEVIPKESQQSVDPILREVLAQRIGFIAEQMGTVLEQTAISVNVKDRRDFSCAVFNARGELIANAPHVPVHLGAMSATVQSMMNEFPNMQPDDCFITNDPYRGGSHLPDVTVVTPVFASSQVDSKPSYFVACRAHHAEIGGIAPGSMAPTSKNLEEEGVLVPPMYLSKGGTDCSPEIERLLKDSRWPSRATNENLADIRAQQAANQFGKSALLELTSDFGVDLLQRYMEHIQSASEAKTRRWIESLPICTMQFEDHMDDGLPIRVRLRRTSRHEASLLQIDFTGTGMESPGNLNANPAIVSAAVMYVVRCAIGDDMPLNSGVMRCIELIIPKGLLNPQCRTSANADTFHAADWPAVAGGNVETSQRVVDCLLGALGLAASSQGTMNNFLFGDATFGYYETICGGAGATALGDGASAVHTHMTNTRLTDVEILEKRYPVRLTRFAIRKGSGGHGKYRGGDGIIREIQALTPLTVSLVTSRRGAFPPKGIAGGSDGAIGENWQIDPQGSAHRLDSSVQLNLQTNESIRILTPGGGGYGPLQS